MGYFGTSPVLVCLVQVLRDRKCVTGKLVVYLLMSVSTITTAYEKDRHMRTRHVNANVSLEVLVDAEERLSCTMIYVSGMLLQRTATRRGKC